MIIFPQWSILVICVLDWEFWSWIILADYWQEPFFKEWMVTNLSHVTNQKRGNILLDSIHKIFGLGLFQVGDIFIVLVVTFSLTRLRMKWTCRNLTLEFYRKYQSHWWVVLSQYFVPQCFLSQFFLCQCFMSQSRIFFLWSVWDNRQNESISWRLW